MHVPLPRGHGGSERPAKTLEERKETDGKSWRGNLISGCARSIEIIPITFKYAPPSRHSPLFASSSSLLPPLPHPARPAPRPPGIILAWTPPNPNARLQRSPQSMSSHHLPSLVSPTGISTGRRRSSAVPGHAPSVAQPRWICPSFADTSGSDGRNR